MIKTLLYILTVISILVGLYKLIIDDEKGVSYASFIFGILTFLLTLIPTEEQPSEPVGNPSTGIIREESENEDLEESETENLPIEDDGAKDKVVSISGDRFSGSLVTEEEEDCYEYIPSISGTYRFDFESDNATTDYKFYIYSSNGEKIVDSYYSSKGRTAELNSGEKYRIVVKQYHGETKYEVIIGVPNSKCVISGTDIQGKITYIDQKDEYTYTAPKSGKYRFDFSSDDVQGDYKIYMYTSNNEQLFSTYFSNKGKTIDLKEGETYTIFIQQYSRFLFYDISIGIPNDIKNIEGNSFSGNITFTDQVDQYTYIAPITGKYHFDFITDNVQSDYRFYLYTSNNEQLASTYYSNKGKTLDLIAGEVYRIEVKQYSGFENYMINIGIPNSISNIEGNIISGNITYTDQENIYTYKAPITGNYKFTFGSNDVNTDYKFYIISSINEQLVSTYFSNSSKVVQLEEGQTYIVKVKQYSGFPTYQIDIGMQ